MSGVKHTPGPWSDKGGSAGAVWAGNEFIASVYPNAQPGWDGYGRFDRQDETEANARLIASAPDLLEACVEAAKTFRRYESLHLDKGTVDGAQKAAANASHAKSLEAIIARARGEQDGGGE